jgi:BCD family chlorophyll transporter-like MFS transporter
MGALGAVVVLMTSTLNRVMVVELGLAATIPGLLVGLHYALQLARPWTGFGSDATGWRTPWIIGGMALLGLGATGAAASVAWMAVDRTLGLAAAAIAFFVIGLGVSTVGTPFLALLAEQVAPARRGGAAAVTWLTMIAGFIVSTVVASRLLEPFSLARLVGVVALVSAAALAVTTLAVWGVEPRRAARPTAPRPLDAGAFARAMATVWGDPTSRRFAVFVFLAMLAFSAQDLILEPFAGRAFGLSPARTTALAGMQNGGMMLGMLLAAVLGQRVGSLRGWAAGGCAASAGALALLAVAPATESLAVMQGAVVAMGIANGAFAIGAIGSMMALTADAADDAIGTRMGVFGAAQGVAMGFGGVLGAAASDVAAALVGSATGGYVTVFAFEAVLFAVSAVLALQAGARQGVGAVRAMPASGDRLLEAIG